MDSIRKANRAAKNNHQAPASIVPLPGITTEQVISLPDNASTNNRVVHNRLSLAPINPDAEIADKQMLIQAQQQQQQSPYFLQSEITPHAVRAPVYDMTTLAAGHATVYSLPAAGPFYSHPAPAATPDMEKRVRKRIAQRLVKEIGKPKSEGAAHFKKIQKKLTTKDPAISRVIADVELEDSQDTLAYLHMIDSPLPKK
jgi:hypothetical protein